MTETGKCDASPRKALSMALKRPVQQTVHGLLEENRHTYIRAALQRLVTLTMGRGEDVPSPQTLALFLRDCRPEDRMKASTAAVYLTMRLCALRHPELGDGCVQDVCFFANRFAAMIKERGEAVPSEETMCLFTAFCESVFDSPDGFWQVAAKVMDGMTASQRSYLRRLVILTLEKGEDIPSAQTVREFLDSYADAPTSYRSYARAAARALGKELNASWTGEIPFGRRQNVQEKKHMDEEISRDDDVF